MKENKKNVEEWATEHFSADKPSHLSKGIANLSAVIIDDPTGPITDEQRAQFNKFIKTRLATVTTAKVVFGGRVKASDIKHGGSRPGAGKKRKESGEKKVATTVRMYPSDKKKIVKKFGTLQKGIDSLTKE